MGKASDQLLAEDIISYLKIIYELPHKTNGPRCYRGQSNSNWKLKPSVMRNLRHNAENQILSELLLEAPAEFSSDRSMFDKLVRAQHYSLPTRLLDVSLNPLVALYFACNETEQHNADGVVQIFDFSNNRTKFADSDTISIICNLSRLSEHERDNIFENYSKFGLKDNNWSNEKVMEFRNTPEIKRLMQYVRVEKPYFLDSINPNDLFRYYFVHPAKNNKRIIAQSGAFIAAGMLKYKYLERSAALKHKKITIPKLSKQKIVNQLDTLNINTRTLFPEIEFSSNYIRNKWIR